MDGSAWGPQPVQERAMRKVERSGRTRGVGVVEAGVARGCNYVIEVLGCGGYRGGTGHA